MRHTSSAPSPSFVDPSSLSLPSPPSEASTPPQSNVIDPSLASSGSTSHSTFSSRKRARTDATPEEKREARAHRNRIAAQNSRDKRKAQFCQLEEKVRALQQENDQLRAQLQQERLRRDGAEKDRENAELKERVKSLEEGWEAVLKALQSQGIPSSTVTNTSKKEDTSSPSTSLVIDPTLQPSPSTTFPVFINPSPVLLPSSPPPSTAPTVPPQSTYQPNDEPTRHLARVATAAPTAASLQRVVAAPSAQDFSKTSTDEDGRIEDWCHEVLASSDSPTINDSITGTASPASGISFTGLCSGPEAASSIVNPSSFPSGSMGADGDDMELERLLNLLPDPGDDLQSLLASVMDDGKVSEAVEGWNWELTQPSAAVV